MRLLLSLMTVWFVLCLLIGAAGTLQLSSYWRSAEDRLLTSDSDYVALKCSATAWVGPMEDDPQLLELELSRNLDIAPLFNGPSSEGARPAAVDATAPQTNDWTLLPSGQWQISRSVKLAEPVVKGDPHKTDSTSSVIALKLTRRVDFTRVQRLWWVLWSATFLLGCCVTGVSTYTLRQQRKYRQRALQPWVSVAQQIRSSTAAKLPETHPGEDDLSIQLSILRDAINGWLADLQNNIQRNELVLSNLQEGVLAVDDRSRVLLANTAVVRLLGITSEEYLYRSLVEVIRTPRVVSLIERVLKNSTPQEESFEHGPKLLSLKILVRPIQIGGERQGALMTVRDETLVKRVESVRRDFVTNASHELKTPLAAIRAYAETLQMGAMDDPEVAQNFLAGILAQADRINGLITGMLQLARVQTGGAMLKKIRFDVQQEIQNCLDATEALANAKSITLTTHFPAQPVFMKSDPEAVQTVVSNLLSNAVRYTPQGGKVSLQVAARGEAITIRVQDSGIGIEKDELERIFERFYRVERARTADTGGTGLGLSIAKHLLHALGGSVTVTSEPNVGSCFEVSLPTNPT